MRVVDFALRLAGDVSSFTPSVRTEMKGAIAARAGVEPSAVMVTVTSGSVIVGVRILTPPARATSVQSAMANATSSPSSATAMLASVTGVSIAVLAVVTPPIIANVAPLPPPSSPSPSPPPQRPPSALISAGGGAISILAIAVPAAIIVLLCCLAMVCWWTRRRQVKLPRKDANHWLGNVSVSTVTADDHHQQEPPTASIPSGSGSGSGEGSSGGVGIEMSGRFDHSSSDKDRMTRAQELLKAFELDAREIRTLEKLGEGGQAIVVRGWWHGMEVAIKQPRPLKWSRGKPISPDAFGPTSPHDSFNQDGFVPTSPHDSFNQALRREVRALSRVRHPNVIKLYGACFEPAPMVLMSYAPSGTLQDALDNHLIQTPLAMVRLLAGIARGMEAVHAHKIIHLDLKPENVLIGP
eukprot:jgi/Chrpa1/24208/Chrysochromulina_OHIO_Genome00027605-RA